MSMNDVSTNAKTTTCEHSSVRKVLEKCFTVPEDLKSYFES